MSGSGPFADDEKCRDFVDNLVRLRRAYGWTQEKLAAEAILGKGVVANIEAFQRAPLVDHGQAIDKALGLSDVFEAKARAIQQRAFSPAFQSFPEHESTADDLYVYQHSLFPGLIQTERYMRAVFGTLPDLTADEIDRLVAGRLARQEVLYRETPRPPRVWALVDEAALRRPVADATVMHEQCMHALEVSCLPHVSLAVVPYAVGGHIGLSGACDIVERDGVPRVVNLDDLADGRVSEEAALVRMVALRFRSLQHDALSSWDSRDMIARIAEELWNGSAPTGVRALTAPPTVARV